MKKFFFSILVLAIFGCGPEKTSLEKDREQNQENINQRVDELALLVGKYAGTLRFDDETASHQVTLSLSLHRESSAELPIITGGLHVFNRDGGQTTWLTVASFDRSDYVVKTGQLALYSTIPGYQGQFSQAKYDMLSTFDGTNIIGTISSTLRADIGRIHLKRVKE